VEVQMKDRARAEAKMEPPAMEMFRSCVAVRCVLLFWKLIGREVLNHPRDTKMKPDSRGICTPSHWKQQENDNMSLTY
jgi:hypothetical protein